MRRIKAGGAPYVYARCGMIMVIPNTVYLFSASSDAPLFHKIFHKQSSVGTTNGEIS